MPDGEVVLRKLGDLARIRPTIEPVLQEPDENARISLQREMPPEEVQAQTPRRPNNRATLEFAWVATTLLGRGRCARQGACDVELVGVVVLQQRDTGAARGNGGAECELAIETRLDERGANVVGGTTSRGRQALPGRRQAGASKVVEGRGELGEMLDEATTVASEA